MTRLDAMPGSSARLVIADGALLAARTVNETAGVLELLDGP